MAALRSDGIKKTNNNPLNKNRMAFPPSLNRRTLSQLVCSPDRCALRWPRIIEDVPGHSPRFGTNFLGPHLLGEIRFPVARKSAAMSVDNYPIGRRPNARQVEGILEGRLGGEGADFLAKPL